MFSGELLRAQPSTQNDRSIWLSALWKALDQHNIDLKKKHCNVILRLLDDVENQSNHPLGELKASICHRLLCAQAKQGDILQILDDLETYQRNGIPIGNKCILDVAFTLAHSGHVSAVGQLWPRLSKDEGAAIFEATKGWVDRKLDSVVVQVLNTLPRDIIEDTEGQQHIGTFFRHLIASNRNASQLEAYCKAFGACGINHEVHLLCLNLLEDSRRVNFALRLLRSAMKQNSSSIFPHTIETYVRQHLNIGSAKMLGILRKIGVSDYIAFEVMFMSCVSRNNLKEAVRVAKHAAGQISIRIEREKFQMPIIKALIETEDISSFVECLRFLSEYQQIINVHALFAATEEDSKLLYAQRLHTFLGEILYETMLAMASAQRQSVSQNILREVVGHGLTIPESDADRIANLLECDDASDTGRLLQLLSSGKLTPKHMYTGFMNMNHTKRLWQQYRSKNRAKYEETFERLKASGYEFNQRHHFCKIHLRVIDKDLNAAKKSVHIFQQKFKESQVEPWLLFELAALHVEKDDIDGAISLLIEHTSHGETEPVDSSRSRHSCLKLLNILADLGNEADLLSVFHTLVNYNHIKVSTSLLAPLVRVHLVNHDINQAIAKFEWLTNYYMATPFQHELFCHLIEVNDFGNLERVAHISSLVHQPDISLLDLVFALIECDRIKQAQAVLTIPAIQLNQNKINSRCQRYLSENAVEYLERMWQVFENRDSVKPAIVLEPLILAYCKQKKPANALALWKAVESNAKIVLTKNITSEWKRYLKAKNVAL